MRGRERIALAVSFLLSLAVTIALAVPVIQLTLQQLGAGYVEVMSPVGKAWINHVFVIADLRISLDKVKIKFDADLGSGTYIRVELRDSNDNVLASGEITLAEEVPAGTWIEVDLSPDLDIYQLLQYSKLVVVVSGPEVGA